MAYDTARAVIRSAKKLKAGAFICEIARSEIGYTEQRPQEYAAILLAAGTIWTLRQQHPKFVKPGELLHLPAAVVTAVQPGTELTPPPSDAKAQIEVQKVAYSLHKYTSDTVLARRIAAKDSGSRAGEPNRAARFCGIASPPAPWREAPTHGWRRFPSYSELMLETDEEGQNHSYMSSEESFRTIKQLQTENRIVPLVGDFAGEKALSAVGEYLKEHGVTVTAFYTSNVEFYLFQTEDWKKFFHNVADLPLDANSLFIRAYFNNYGFRFPNQASGARSVTLLDTMPGLLQAFEAGRIHSYFDVIKRSSQ